jgi:hypothetical protein
MIQCKISGCRNLSTICNDCSRVVCTKNLPQTVEWISVKDQPPPAMRDVLFLAGDYVFSGWNESVQPEEDPSYCSHQDFDSDLITHWMPYPKSIGKS